MKKKNVNHKYELFRLSRIKDFEKIYDDWYYQEFFVKKYILDLPRLAFEVFGTKLTYQQIDIWNEFVKSGAWQGGRLVVPSGHGTGKTLLIGTLAVAHLLLFKKSITRIQAPTIKQVKSGSFKEINENIYSMTKRIKVNDDLILEPKWSFFKDLIQVNKEVIYIKGYDTSWYIEAKTAPRGDSTNLSGQHQLNYLLIIDEASGVEDEHIEASLGALSEEFNSCIMFSQHTKLNGKFHEFATIKSVENGGIWHKIRLSSRYSPRVSKKQLRIWLETYSDEEIRVRIDGLPPKKDIGTLISPTEAYKIYESKGKNKYNSIVFSIDLGYTGYRDSSVITISEVNSIIDKLTEKEKRYYRVLEVNRYSGFSGLLPVEFAKTIAFNKILSFLDLQANKDIYYTNIFIIGDANAGGYEAIEKLEDLFLEIGKYNIEVKKLMWGSERLYFEDKKRFINARAKGYVELRDAIIEDRICIISDNEKNRILKE